MLPEAFIVVTIAPAEETYREVVYKSHTWLEAVLE